MCVALRIALNGMASHIAHVASSKYFVAIGRIIYVAVNVLVLINFS